MRPTLRIRMGAVLALCAACSASPNSDSPMGDPQSRGTREPTQDESARTDGRSPDSERAAPAVSVRAAVNDPLIHGPMDATPSPDGDVVYFAATTAADDADGLAGTLPGLYRTSADGGDIARLCEGAPLVSPTGIAVSLDGETLVVADPGIEDGGALLRGPAGDAAECPEPINATLGMSPRGVVVANVDDREQVLFTGDSSESAEPGLFRLEGDSVVRVASGAPFAAPAGVAVASDGTAYVIDALADDGSAALLRVDGDGDVASVVGGLGVGFPAGVTLDMSESKALVSGLSPETGRDVVYVVDLATADVSTITDPVDAFSEPAGLHRAHKRNVFAWADSEANDTGTVYVLEL